MAAIQKKRCLVCGEFFKPCSTITQGLNWRRLFCSPECCREWMNRQGSPVPEERSEVVQPEEPAAPEVIPESEPVAVEEPEQEIVKPVSRSRKKKTEE